ncbi:MAG: Crp/Fnr family transcriptional regulator [Sandaracinaceae bacterium]
MADRLTGEQVGRLPLFVGLTPEEHDELAALSDVRAVAANTLVFRQGDPSKELYVVLEGLITLSVQNPGYPESSLLSLHEGELLGWSALLARTRMTTARVVRASRLLRLPASEILTLCETDHHVGYAIMRHAFEEVAERLRMTQLQLLDVFGAPGR